MSSPTTTTTAPPGRVFSHGTDVHYGDFRDDLLKNGFAVVKGAVPRDRALKYADEIYDWLEEFGLGFNRHNPSTIHKDRLPDINEKGMCLGYAISHESFTLAVRQEPGVISAFEKVYDTPDLIVSFDSVNIGFPNRTDIEPNKPWPHQDQDPEKPGFRCLQGLVNLLPNGPDDGGLIVCKGAHLLSEEFHEVFKDEERIWSWTKEWYGFTEAGLKWLKDKGCEGLANTALQPLLQNQQPRFAVYTCYMPMAFEETKMTTHWPNAMHVVDLPVHRNGEPDPYDRKKPRKPVQLTERGFKPTCIPYLEARA
ncbi:hypothetical protein BDW66DRAFT_156296 [Aspergillus desertorum]